MTIMCASCHQILGEKCRRCGEIPYEIAPAIWTCYSCQIDFSPGDGGISHGLCPACYEKAKSSLKVNP